MKKKFISSVALAMAAVLTFGMTAFAAGSPTPEVELAPVESLSAVTPEKVTVDSVEVTVAETKSDANTVAEAGLKEAAADASALAGNSAVDKGQIESVTAVAAFDLSVGVPVPSGKTLSVSVKVAGVQAAEKYVCMHNHGGVWEMLKVTAKDGEVTIHGITGFSEFVLVRVNLKQPAVASSSSAPDWQTFVYTFALKDAQGNLQSNEQIVKGIGSYNSLSGSEKLAADQLIKNLTGKTYPELYAAAGGQVSNVSTTPTSPKTGETLPLTGILAAISLAGAAVCATKVRCTK